MAIRQKNLFATPTASVTLEYDDVAKQCTRVLVHNAGTDPINFKYKLIGQAENVFTLPPGPDLNVPFTRAYTDVPVVGRPGLMGMAINGVESFSFSA